MNFSPSSSMPTLVAWYSGRSERERRMLAGLGIALLATVVFGFILPLDRRVKEAHARIDQKQSDLLWMRQVAPEVAGTAPPPQTAQESLTVIVERSARESGLSQAISGSEPNGPGAINVRLEKAPFDTLILWLARLSQQNGIRIDNATIDGAGTPGLVNAAVLLRAG